MDAKDIRRYGMPNETIKNLVFEGGGVKGIAYAGAMKVLEQHKITHSIKRVGGTSAGAINAVLFAIGCSADKTDVILQSLNFNDFKDDSWGVLRDGHRLMTQFGWHKGLFFRKWIGGLIKDETGSAESTFQDVQALSGIELYICASNLSTGFGEVYSPHDTPNMSVVEAVRRSMSIPFFFRAIRNEKQHVIVDGGVLRNFPIKLFDHPRYIENAPADSGDYLCNNETLGLRLDSEEEINTLRDRKAPKAHKIDSLMDFTTSLCATLLSAQDHQHLHSADRQRTVYIPSLGIGVIDFDLTDAQKADLWQSGYQTMTTYLQGK
jgi:NTE family protein